METLSTFHEHVQELRKRLFWVFLAMLASAIVAYGIRNHVVALLQNPLAQTLFYTSPAGGFNFVIRLSTIIGLFVALPVMIYQLLRFVEPALPHRIKRTTFVKLIVASFALASLGIAFGYFYMIPVSLRFFGEYSSGVVRPLISADSYLSFVINNLLTFALSFQIPLIILFINKIKPLGPSKLLHYQRHVIVGAFVFALVLPFTYDPLSQFMVAVPIVFLYYLSVVLLWFAHRRPKQSAPRPQPVFTKPILPVSAAQPRPSVPLRPSLTIDGFIRFAVPNKHNLSVAQQSHDQTSIPVKHPVVNGSARTQRVLSIDGFVQPLRHRINPQVF